MSGHTARVRAGNDRASLYTEITDKIIAELEAGRIPWVQPWGTAAIKAPLAMPRNASTQRGYSGINVLILWGAVIEHGFFGQSWLTFRQALGLGRHVRKGERGTTVVYADRFTPDDERRRAADAGEEPGAIPFLKRFAVFNKVSAGKLQKAGVRTEFAERRTLSTMVRAPGTVQEDERRKSVVSLRFEGFIDTVGNVTTGTHVHKVQSLMRIYGPNLASAAAEYLSALNARPDAGISNQALKGARRRLENLDAPEAFIADIERTREIPSYVNWPAPQDGDIVERTAVNGMRAAPGDVLFRIADHDVVWVLVDVAERDLSLIEVGQKADVRLRAYPDRVFSGKVSLIYPHLMAETRTAQVRIELPNPDDVLRPDMYADVEIATGSEAPVVTVSNSAVIDSGERQIVLLDKGDGRFEPRAVKLGRRGGGHVEIREGLAEGDKVVVSANFLIDAESNLKAALSGLDAGEKSQ